VLFKGQVNESVLPFGQNLSTYIYQITLFLTFNTDDMPFPFMDFPDGAPGSNSSEEFTESMPSTETTMNSEAETIAVVDSNENTAAGNDSKNDDPLVV
jgi:hypothetical protein